METSDQSTKDEETVALQQAQQTYSRLSTLHKSNAYEELVNDNEERIAVLMSKTLNPTTSGMDGLIEKESYLGEIRGIQSVFAGLETKLVMLQQDIEELTTNEHESE